MYGGREEERRGGDNNRLRRRNGLRIGLEHIWTKASSIVTFCHDITPLV